MSRMSCQPLVVREPQQMKPFVLANPQISTHGNIQFLKKISLIALSSISYLRNIFPEDAFSKRNLEGMPVSIIRDTDECPGTRKMMEWITSAFCVIETKCLKKLILLIQKSESNRTLETYSLNFTYDREAIHYALINESGGSKEVLSQSKIECPADIKKAVTQLIRSIVLVVQGMAPLPEDCDVSMLLEFCEKLPEDFKIPEHFKTIESVDIDFPPSIAKIKLGNVEAKYISVGVAAKSVLFYDALFQGGEDEGNNSDNENQPDEDDMMPGTPDNTPTASSSIRFTWNTQIVKNGESLVNSTTSTHFAELPKPAIDPTEDECAEAAPLECESTDLSESMSSINLKSKEVDCLCLFDDSEVDCLKCTVCGTSQHKACYKVLHSDSVEQHVCVKCHTQERPCTAPELVLMNEKNRKTGAVMRRALNICLVMPRVSINSFTTALRFQRALAEKIFNHLDSKGCLKPATGKRNIRAVNLEYLKEHMIPKHFNVPHTDDSMDTEENCHLNKENMVLSNKRSRIDTDGDLSPAHTGLKLNNKRLKEDLSPAHTGLKLNNKRLKVYARSLGSVSKV